LSERPVRPLNAKEDAAVAAHERDAAVRRRMQRLVSLLEEAALLRIHGAHLCSRDAKGARVESLRARYEAAVERARGLHGDGEGQRGYGKERGEGGRVRAGGGERGREREEREGREPSERSNYRQTETCRDTKETFRETV